MFDRKKWMKEYNKAYRLRPENLAKEKARGKTRKKIEQVKEHHKIYYSKEENIQHKRNHNKEYYQKNKIKFKDYNLRVKYGIDLKYFEEIRLAQDNKCAICNIELNPKSHHVDSIHIDHNHTTKKVRGLLCSSCNVMLGYAKDNTTLLQKAIKYLNK